MFSFPKLGGRDCLVDLVNAYGGPTRVCKDFKLTRDLLDVWLTGRQEAPLTAFLAFYWQGPTGMQHGFSESHYANQYNVSRVREAEAKLDRLEQTLAEVVQLLDQSHPALAPIQRLLGPTS